MNKTEYLEKFQDKAVKQFGKKAQDLFDMKNGLSELRTYQKGEEQNVIELQREITELEGKVEPALLDAKGCDDFKTEMQVYKDKLARLRNDLITSREMVATLEKSIPQKHKAIESATGSLNINLDAFVRSQRGIVDAELKSRVLAIEEERAAFLDAFTELYESFGVSFIRHSADLMPGGITKMKLDALKKNCGITEAPAAQSQPPATSIGKGGKTLGREVNEFLNRDKDSAKGDTAKPESNAKTAVK